ncbi:MAG: hypothetical protein AUH10_12325 [Gammaproteobacteria bacterium 13_2_20CM_66_19]|nr:MAG: hypothetical protein AUH10_12325 [Gammaproteobacteria bacterium 13_2_20CM_66_19]
MAGGINLNGPHYNLNIIGVENPKTDAMTGGDRHTIFVALGAKNSAVTSRIYLTPGPFAVCDGNAFDPAYACDGTLLAQQGAVFQLPCDTAVTTTNGCASGIASASYLIWARALGTPGGTATVTTCAYDLTGALVCSTDNAVQSRTKGKSTFYNVTSALTTINACFDVGGVVTCQTVSLFDPVLQDYFWQYANSGLRLLQLRFYPQ